MPNDRNKNAEELETHVSGEGAERKPSSFLAAWLFVRKAPNDAKKRSVGGETGGDIPEVVDGGVNGDDVVVENDDDTADIDHA